MFPMEPVEMTFPLWSCSTTFSSLDSTILGLFHNFTDNMMTAIMKIKVRVAKTPTEIARLLFKFFSWGSISV